MPAAFYSLLASLVINVFVFGYVFRSSGFKRHTTLSDHVATGNIRSVYVPESIGASIFFSMGLLLLAGSFTNFNLAAYVLVVTNFIAHTVLVLVPRLKDKVKLHDNAAAVFGTTSLLFIILGFLATDNTSFFRVVFVVLVTCMTLLGAYIYDKTRRNYVFLQLTYYVLMYSSLLLLVLRM